LHLALYFSLRKLLNSNLHRKNSGCRTKRPPFSKTCIVTFCGVILFSEVLFVIIAVYIRASDNALEHQSTTSANESSRPEKPPLIDLNPIQEFKFVPQNHQRLLATALQIAGRIERLRSVRLSMPNGIDVSPLDPNPWTDESNVQPWLS
jgi:hypothetical protein